jgi:hypothetical protein
MVELPDNMVVQGVNGYPRLCESFALWFVIFTDKSLIEIGNTIAAPGLMLATYVIARRYASDRAPLIGWSSAILLMPAMLTQTRTSMIDVQVAFFLVAATHFATRPTLRMRDALTASLLLGLLVGSKSSALVWVPPLALVTYARLLSAQRKERLRQALAIVVIGGVFVAGVAALTFVRNWIAFRNPLWPVSYENARLHIRWPGLVTLERISPDLPVRELTKKKYHQPIGGISDIIARDYGYGVPWIVVPLGAVSLIGALITAARARIARLPDRSTENLLLVAALGVAFVKTSPSLDIARYNAQIVAIAMVCIAWAAGRLQSGLRFHEGAVASTLLMTIVPMFWTDWFFGVDFQGIYALRRHTAAERSTMHFAGFQMPADVAKVRERDLGEGDLVIFTQEMAFPGVLWNQRMSNRVEYVELKDVPSFLAEIERRKPKWVVVGGKSVGREGLTNHPAEWEVVGTACRQDGTIAFRKK